MITNNIGDILVLNPFPFHFISFRSIPFFFIAFSMFLSIILILTLGSVIGMIIHRNLFIKFFLCFESFFFIISVIILI